MKTGHSEIRIRIGLNPEPLTHTEAVRVFESILSALNDEHHKGHLRP